MRAAKGNSDKNAVSHRLSETQTERLRSKPQRVWIVHVNEIKIVVCVIVYCLLGLCCGRVETRKDEEMAENGSHVAPEATVIQSDDEEQRKELYPNTVSIVINFARECE